MTSTEKLFLALYRSALWDTPVDEKLLQSDVDWEQLMDMATKQTIMGVITDAVTKLPKSLRPPKTIYYNLVMYTSNIEKRNNEMNAYTPMVMKSLKEKGSDTFLLKGQGLSMYYPNPLHRQSGDIDLFVGFDLEYFRKTCENMKSIASSVEEVKDDKQHGAFTYKEVCVEIHGTIHSFISKKCAAELRSWCVDRLKGEPVVFHSRLGDIKMPPRNFDALYVFIHLATHYMGGGVGLRQITDWMMYLHKNYNEIDIEMLKNDIQRLGIEKVWRVFGTMAVNEFGFPANEMPFYDDKVSKKSTILLRHIFKTGNFGAVQKEKHLSSKSNKYLKKFVTFIGQIPIYIHNLRVFPSETAYCFVEFIKDAFVEMKRK